MTPFLLSLGMFVGGVILFWFVGGVKPRSDNSNPIAAVIGFLLIMTSWTPIFPDFWPATVTLFTDVFTAIFTWFPKAFNPKGLT